MFESYKELKIWQKGIELVVKVYEQTKSFPKEEQYGLTSQMRRCAVSIPSNIAEGWGRGSKNHLRQFINIARGSLLELETQVQIAGTLGFLNKQAFESLDDLIIEESKMINGFLKTLD